MRISTSQIFDGGIRGVTTNQAGLYKTQNHLSTGRKVLTPADDPVASAQVLVTTQAKSVTKQYMENQKNAREQLGLEEDRLSAAINVLQQVRERTVQMGNGTYTDAERSFAAVEVGRQFEQLMAIANSTDAAGMYLFSGYKGATQPFVLDAAGHAQYQGDDGQRLLQVDAARKIPISDSGFEIFGRVAQGNGTFVTGAAAANQGTGVITGGSVTDPTQWTGYRYEIAFQITQTDDPTKPDVRYSIREFTSPTDPGTDLGDTLDPNYPFVNVYSANASIAGIPGIEFAISGVPYDPDALAGQPSGTIITGDSFTVDPSSSQSIFKTLKDLATLFETPFQGIDSAKAQYQTKIGTALNNLTQALDNIDRVRASIGARQSEIDALEDVSGDSDIRYQSTLSRLQDLDYAEAISSLQHQQLVLEAAQRSFVRISGLSLFNSL